MTNTELTRIREEKKLSKKEFAELLGISPMLLGKYEKGSCAIPESVSEKLAAAENAATDVEAEVKKDDRKGAGAVQEKAEEAETELKKAVQDQALATEIEIKKNVRRTVRNAKEAVKTAASSDAAVATEIEVKKNVRKAARKAKEAVEAAASSDAAVATEIEVKKNVRKAANSAKKAVKKAAEKVKESARKSAGMPNIVIQSPMGGYITSEEIGKKVPKNTTDVYVRVDENKLYYVLDNGETGDVDIWE